MSSLLMSMFYWTILIVLTIFAWNDWKKTVIVWMPLSMLFNECVCLKYTPPALSLKLAVDIMLLILYYLRGIKQSGLSKGTYFFKEIFIAYLISYGISMFFSIMPINEVITNTIKYFLQRFVIVFLFFRALSTEEDLALFVKSSCYVMGLIMVLGGVEAITKDNPWLDLVYYGSPAELIKEKMYYVPPHLNYESADMRFGVRRCYSFFHIHIAYGCACVMYLFLYMHLLMIKYRFKKLLMFSTLCALLGIVICNSKTGMVGLIFFTMACFRFKQMLNPKLITIIIVVFVFILIYIPEYLNNMLALFNNEVMEEGGGSSTAMRQRQFEIGLRMFMQNPLFGNGVNSLSVLSSHGSYTDILGSESSWLKILPERGIIGVIVYLYLYFVLFLKLKSIIPIKKVVFFLMGLLAMETATGFMEFTIYGSIVVFLWRFAIINKRKKLELKFDKYNINV